MAPEEEQFEDLPPSLIEALKSADLPMPMITARVDREISKTARTYFSMRRGRLRMPRPIWAAIAATVLIAVLIAELWIPAGPDQGTVYADIDQSGRIDIADVLALARMQKHGERSQAELDAFALRIVSLKPGDDAS